MGTFHRTKQKRVRTLAEAIKRHTKTGEFILASGETATEYLDLREALICYDCSGPLEDFFEILGEISYADQIHYIVTGTFGAILVGRGYLDTEHLYMNKDHGTPWLLESNKSVRGKPAIIVDDIQTTGGTIDRILQAATEKGFKVIGALTIAEKDHNGKIVPTAIARTYDRLVGVRAHSSEFLELIRNAMREHGNLWGQPNKRPLPPIAQESKF